MLKVVATKLCKRGDGQDGTPWQYTVGYPVEECLSEGYFNPAVSNFLAGDEVRVVRKEKGYITEILDVIVTKREQNPALVVVAAMGEVIRIPLPKVETDEPAAPVDEVYVPEDCTAQFKGPVRMWEIVGTSGTIYSTGIEDGDEAKSIARGDLAVPAKEAA